MPCRHSGAPGLTPMLPRRKLRLGDVATCPRSPAEQQRRGLPPSAGKVLGQGLHTHHPAEMPAEWWLLCGHKGTDRPREGSPGGSAGAQDGTSLLPSRWLRPPQSKVAERGPLSPGRGVSLHERRGLGQVALPPRASVSLFVKGGAGRVRERPSCLHHGQLRSTPSCLLALLSGSPSSPPRPATHRGRGSMDRRRGTWGHQAAPSSLL